ncbi:hypothetical protein ENBRE01_0594 [Enteropsectra breve]|nr:hypothetical protein ENBRE01_0594 [Enteropsectra breve]
MAESIKHLLDYEKNAHAKIKDALIAKDNIGDQAKSDADILLLDYASAREKEIRALKEEQENAAMKYEAGLEERYQNIIADIKNINIDEIVDAIVCKIVE